MAPLTVYYNTKCPVCDAGIDFQRNRLVHLEGEFIFGLGPSEEWSFAVYLYSQDKDLLVPVWRRKSKTTNRRAVILAESGRGEKGTSEKAFVDKRSIITGNAQHPDAALFRCTLEKTRDYDKGSYRSFASVPIGPLLAEDSRPYGVWSLSLEIMPACSHKFRRAIASFLITGDIDIDKLETS